MELIINPDVFLSKQRRFAESIAVVLTAAVIGSLIAHATAPAYMKFVRSTMIEKGLSREQVEVMLSVIYLTSMLMPIVVTFISWIAIAVMLYVASIPFRGSGAFREVLKLSAFSYVPVIILSPINFYISSEISKTLELYGLEAIKTLNGLKSASMIIGMAVLIWQYVYWVFAVKNARNLDTRKSAIASLFPLVVFAVISLIGTLLRTY